MVALRVLRDYLLFVPVIILFLDQITKFYAQKLDHGTSLPVLDGVLSITLVHNFGASFGLFRQFPLILTVIAAVTLCVCLYLFYSTNKRWVAVPLSILLGGVAGNLLDRIMFGYVLDFIHFHGFPVFNIADAAIFISVVMLIVTLWYEEQHDEQAFA